MDYINDPQAIYAQSFATIRAEAKLDHLSEAEQLIAIRMIHACGMVDLIDDIVISNDFVASALTAIHTNKPIFVDAEMVRHGIIPRQLPPSTEIICTLNDPAARDIGVSKAMTRSAAAVELWQPKLASSLVVIGNAPTALFHLLELIDQGAAKPAAIIACPVGFVGAAESKAEITANPRGLPFITVKGRRGGSAIASSVVNALATFPSPLGKVPEGRERSL
jgi:precorrin-8X/cobalt-precorrin-8 methylmutase